MFTSVTHNKTSYPTYIKDIGYGEEANKNTLNEMSWLISSGLRDWGIRETAQDIISNTKERDRHGELKGIYQWVQRHSRYTYDPIGLETIQTPKVMLESVARKGKMFGDCDDFTVLLGALLKSIGHKIRLKAVAFSPGTRLSHVYLEDEIAGKWVTVDGIKKDKPLGYTSPLISRFITKDV